MKKLAILTLVIFQVWSAMALACGDSPVLSTRKDDGTEIGLFLPESKMQSTSKWTPELGEPPLSPSEAYRIAIDWARLKYTRYDDVRVREISLTRYRCSNIDDRWYYLMDLEPVIDGNSVWGPGNWVAVLMDGTVVAPTVVK